MTTDKSKNKNANAAADETAGWEETEDEFGEVWEPKEGEFIVGTYLGARLVPSEDGDEFLSHKIKQADGHIHAIAGARLDQLMEFVPEDGQVKILYVGKKELDKKRTMSEFKIFQPPKQKIRPANTRRGGEAQAS